MVENAFNFGIIALLFITSLFAFRKIFYVVTIEMKSMAPTLKEGDKVLVCRYWPKNWLQRGCIVILIPSDQILPPEQGSRLFPTIPVIKRITGLPGDIVETHLNKLDGYHQEKLKPYYDESGKRTWYIPQKHVFVRGDNPGGICDSTIWGPIPDSSLVGIVIAKLSNNQDKLS